MRQFCILIILPDANNIPEARLWVEEFSQNVGRGIAAILVALQKFVQKLHNKKMPLNAVT